jgi:divalent metal cation (Fe/Co/Zn/Cd) transporter
MGLGPSSETSPKEAGQILKVLSGMSITQAAERTDLVRQAFWLEWLTIAWMVIEAAVALWSGYTSHSITLLAFGLDSVIELVSAGVLVWRLTIELRHGQVFSESAEHRASKIGGALLFALAAYVIASAAWSLWTQRAEEFSLAGFGVALAAIPIMYFLAKRKIAIADKIGSRALRADAVESITCGWLSVMVVVGLTAQYLIGAWWIDSVTSLAIVWFLVKEGREAWAAEECGCSSGH